MADNIRRALQDIDVGDEPIPLPIEVVNQATAENRFVLMGRPVMPQRHNLCSVVAALPRLWGQTSLIHGRVIEDHRFQFVFPSEESMEAVLHRDPCAFVERMLILQHWTPLTNLLMLNFIPFWIQIRGIPLQYMKQEIVAHIGRAMGQLMDIDYNVATAAQVEYVRVRLNWDVAQPLHFQRNFQFTPDVNTLLRFRYERLRGFCEAYGLMTHDSGNGFIQNGGGEHHSDNDDSDDDHPNQAGNNHGPQIQEMNDEDQAAANHNAGDMIVDHGLEQNGVDEATDDLMDARLGSMFAIEMEMNELFNPCSIFSNATGDVPSHDAPPIQGYKRDAADLIEIRVLYMVYNATTEDTRSGQRKRKHDEEKTKTKHMKSMTHEVGESSGTAGSDDDTSRGYHQRFHEYSRLELSRSWHRPYSSTPKGNTS